MIPASYKPRKKFMELAIAEAKRAGDRGDYPIGAVITRLAGGREVVIASAGNRVKTSGSSIKHVELETLKYVSSGYGRYLTDFVLYSTHEPCAMCAGALVHARVKRLIYGADDPKAGAIHSVMEVLNHPRLNHRTDVRGGVLAGRCAELLQTFFRNRRPEDR